MFAQIIPLIRMPRRFAHFDYAIPNEIDVCVGDLVNIKFKNRIIQGVVREVSDKTDYKKINTIQSIAQKQIMSKEDITRLERIAYNIIQSPSTVLHCALNGIKSSNASNIIIKDNKSGSIDVGTADIVKQTCEIKQDHTILETSYEGAIAACRIICAKAKNQILIIVPRERDAEIFSSYIPYNHVVLNGKTKLAQRKWILNSWKSGELKILIGTKQASLIPANKIDNIIIFDCNSDDHVSYNMNPRYDARLCLKLLSKQHNANILQLNFAQYLSATKTTTIADIKPLTKIIDLKDQNEKTNTFLISHSLQNAIAKSLQNKKPVLLSYNAKGIAKCLQCNICGHIPLCGTCGKQPIVRVDDLICDSCKSEMWIPKICPACNKNKLRFKGIGNKKLSSDISKLFPNARVTIVDKEHSKISNADIIIVTEHYFQSLYKPFESRYGVIAEICADKLMGYGYRSVEIMMYKLNRLSHIAHACKSELIVQTWSPQLIKQMLDDKFSEAEVQIRKKYLLPPFTDEFIIFSDDVHVHDDLDSINVMKINGNTIIYSNEQYRCKIISMLKQLDDSIKILTNYQSYEA
jgi:primosomal protein N'